MSIDLTPEPGMPRDTRLIERAIEERWPIPKNLKAKIIERQVAIATSELSGDREATSAAKCLVAMDAQNMEQEKREGPQPEGVTVNIQNNGGTVSLNDRRTDLVGIIGAALDRQRAAASSGTIDPAADAERGIPSTPAD